MLTLNTEIELDEFHKEFWTLMPVRHLRLKLVLCNHLDAPERVRVEILLPEPLFISVPTGGAVWNPSHRHELEGQNYLVWDTAGGFGRYRSDGGVGLAPGSSSTQVLDVNLQPEAKSVVLFWRLFVKEEMDNVAEPFHRVQLDLKPFVPSL